MRVQTPITSKLARDKFLAEGKEDAHERLIINALTTGDYTSYEIGRLTGLHSTQVSRRTIRLERLKIILRTGEKRKDIDGSVRLVYSLVK